MYDFPDPRNTWGYSKVLAGTGALTKGWNQKSLHPRNLTACPRKLMIWKTRFLLGLCRLPIFEGRTVQFSWGFFTQRSLWGRISGCTVQKAPLRKVLESTFGGPAQHRIFWLANTTTNLRTSTNWNVCFLVFFQHGFKPLGNMFQSNLTPKNKPISPEVRDHF